MAIRENFGEIGRIRLERWALEDANPKHRSVLCVGGRLIGSINNIV